MRRRCRPHRVICLLGIPWLFSCNETDTVKEFTAVARPARISPDYSDTVIPPNIAPLNFVVREAGVGYLVTIHAGTGKGIEVFSDTGRIQIPLRPWKELLRCNRSGNLLWDIYVKGDDGQWRRYEPMSVTIAEEDIDSHLAYRVIRPIYNFWTHVGVYQRDLTTYDESPILRGETFDNGCVNCHSFPRNDPDSMFIGVRSKHGGATILAREGRAVKIGRKFGYTTWHPSGRSAVFSINKVVQFFHTAGPEVREVADLDAALAQYDCDSQAVTVLSGLARKDRLETYPAWSHDGKRLYFCSAPILWRDRDAVPPDRHDEVKYDLLCATYDVGSGAWGTPDTVLSSEETGLSIMQPRPSPDGRFLLFCMCNYGCFPVHQRSSDLYLMDLATRKYRKLSINSDLSESWHSWSSNSRWIAFNSKRQGGFLTRTYFSYVDTSGRAHKAFILPQKDPEFYDSFIKIHSLPELITGPVTVSQRALYTAVKAPKGEDITVTGATRKADSLPPWVGRRE